MVQKRRMALPVRWAEGAGPARPGAGGGGGRTSPPGSWPRAGSRGAGSRAACPHFAERRTLKGPGRFPRALGELQARGLLRSRLASPRRALGRSALPPRERSSRGFPEDGGRGKSEMGVEGLK